MFKVDRPRMGRRPGPVVTAEVLGWNNTHVLFNVSVGGKLKTQWLTRPIERFMVEYAL